MTDDVAMSTAARELGLTPGAMALAAQLGEVSTVPGQVRRGRAGPATPAGASTVTGADTGADKAQSAGSAGSAPAGGRAVRRVPRAELLRLRAQADFPEGLRERLRVVDGGHGARLLGISASRFARLARAGCFSPVRFYVNRYRTVVWLYLAAELLAFAANRPEMLSGRLPRGLRSLLAEGMDLRARHWRGRRVGQLCRQAEGPWEAAAARAAVLGEDALTQAVPDPGERARLRALKPELTPLTGRPAPVREVAEELCTAATEDEIFWQRLMLAADLEYARVSRRASPDRAEAASEPCEGPPLGGRRTGVRLLGRPLPGDPRTGSAHAPWLPGTGPGRHMAGAAYAGATGRGRDRARALQERTRVLTGLRASRHRPPADVGPPAPGRRA
ncbi:DUF6397 family protein [Streptomyces marispadix]|uniref:DUF6397 family protein n=1 Tax=Streptomyces marispadix TaxID=2922868 RepID=A0ABS9T5V7_9ACTN|nr:DUF6397 family protein [Streptomyces marispadix]MCH6163917.1 DUF6397 family protein [Streptomyces marispadix]